MNWIDLIIQVSTEWEAFQVQDYLFTQGFTWEISDKRKFYVCNMTYLVIRQYAGKCHIVYGDGKIVDPYITFAQFQVYLRQEKLQRIREF